MKARGLLWTAIAVVLAWLVIGGVSGPFAGRLSEVATNDNAAFLPGRRRGHPGPGPRGRLHRAGDHPGARRLRAPERHHRRATARRPRPTLPGFAQIPGVITPLPPPIPSEDGQALEVIVPIDDSDGDAVVAAVDAMRAVAGRPARRAHRARRRAGPACSPT